MGLRELKSRQVRLSQCKGSLRQGKGAHSCKGTEILGEGLGAYSVR